MTDEGTCISQSELKQAAGVFPAILGKGPWPKLGKMIDLTAKLGENNDIEHKKGSKLYPQNQVIFRLYNANHTT